MSGRFLFTAPWVWPGRGAAIRDGAVAVEKDKILAVGRRATLEKKFPRFQRRRFPSALLLPGFVDCHRHSVYFRLDGRRLPRRFPRWLAAMVRGFGRRRLFPQEGIRAALYSGVTALADSGPSLEPLRLMKRAGLRGIFYLEVFPYRSRDPEKSVRAAFLKIKAVQKKLPPRLKAGIAVHSPYTCPPGLLKAISHRCRREKIPLTIHLAESPEEKEFLRSGDGALSRIFPGRAANIPRAPSPARYLEFLGALGGHLLAAHCVQAGADDLRLLARRGAAVAACPGSNAWLRVGRPRVAAMLRSGLRVGLGVDSPASNPAADMFSTLRAAAKLPGLNAEKALALATAGGAGALGIGREAGRLAPGKKADLIAVAVVGGASRPLSRLLRCRPADVKWMMIDGKEIVPRLL